MPLDLKTSKNIKFGGRDVSPLPYPTLFWGMSGPENDFFRTLANFLINRDIELKLVLLDSAHQDDSFDILKVDIWLKNKEFSLPKKW